MASFASEFCVFSPHAPIFLFLWRFCATHTFFCVFSKKVRRRGGRGGRGRAIVSLSARFLSLHPFSLSLSHARTDIHTFSHADITARRAAAVRGAVGFDQLRSIGKRRPLLCPPPTSPLSLFSLSLMSLKVLRRKTNHTETCKEEEKKNQKTLFSRALFPSIQWCAPPSFAAAALAACALSDDRRHDPYRRPTEKAETRRTWMGKEGGRRMVEFSGFSGRLRWPTGPAGPSS